MRTATYIIVFIIVTIGIAFTLRFTDITDLSGQQKGKKGDKKERKEKEELRNEISASPDVSILEKYELPSVLKEISAVVFLDQDRFVCVQDELGKIFIYNIKTEKIEKEVAFGDPGDYEGLAIAGEDAYVLRADGVVFEVNGYTGSGFKTVQHETHLTVDNDTEGLCYDAKNRRLLVAVKGTDPGSRDYKGIYALNLKDFRMDKKPVYQLDLHDKVFASLKGKKKGANMQPSGIAIHPVSGDIYIIEGSKPKLLVLDSKGSAKSLKVLSKKDFNQPEGITFSPQGELFISNEGGKGKGNILKVKISAL